MTVNYIPQADLSNVTVGNDASGELTFSGTIGGGDVTCTLSIPGPCFVLYDPEANVLSAVDNLSSVYSTGLQLVFGVDSIV